MVNRSRLIFIGGICMAIAYGTAQDANAESIDIKFSGTVPHACAIAPPSQTPTSAPSSLTYNTNLLDVACNDHTQVDDDHWAQGDGQAGYDQAPANVQDTAENVADGYRTITPQ